MSWLRQLAELALHEQRDHHKRVEASLYNLEHQFNSLKEIAMSNQDQINALTDKVTGMSSDIASLVTSNNTLITATNDLTAEVKALKDAAQNGETLDFTAANAAVDAADQAVKDAKTTVDTAVSNNPDPGPQGG
jgi:peptidoglycan hydrolase CwlO-like protein